jgi:hypothetical protein
MPNVSGDCCHHDNAACEAHDRGTSAKQTHILATAMPNARTSPPTGANGAGGQCGPRFCHAKSYPAEAGSEKRRWLGMP